MRLLLSVLAVLLLAPAPTRAADDGRWQEQAPLHRVAHAAFLDAPRDRMILAGGVIENYEGDPAYDGATHDVWTLDLANPTSWVRLETAGGPPAPVIAPIVTLDPPRSRLLWVGGAGASMGDVWTLSLSGPPVWTLHAAVGPLPPARSHAAAAWDPVRDRLVVCGGEGVGGALGDVWTLSLSTLEWQPVAPAGAAPSARSRAAFAYDPPRDRFLLIGGRSAVAPEFRADVWALELSGAPSWIEIAAAGGPPEARAAASIAYDAFDDRFIVFGGGRSWVWLNDLWSLDVSGAPSWAPLAAAGGPPSVRSAHSAVFDPLRRHMIVYGGVTFYGTDEGWRLDLSGPPAWTPLPMAFDRPDARQGATLVTDTPNERWICFGGGAPGQQTWATPIGGSPQWTVLTPSGTPPAARRHHSAIVDPVRRRMIVFGGTGTSGQLNDVWAFALEGPAAWTQLFPTGTPPAARASHAATYDPVGDRMIVFGGHTGTSDHNDVWALSLGPTPAWTRLSPGGTPPVARSGMAAAWDPVYSRMIVYGGFTQGGLEYLGDTWALRLAGSPLWRLIRANGAGPQARYATASAVDSRRGRLLIFGGAGSFGASVRTNQVWAMSFADSAWTPLAPQGFLPSVRTAAIAAYDSSADRMFAYGGFTGVDFSEVHWMLAFTEPVVSVPPRPDAGPAFALYGAAPHPVRGDLTVSFRLPDASPARIEVFDVVGRRLRSVEVGARGAGVHTLRLASRGELPAGVYLVRLARAGEQRVARAVVLE